jgi:hypothetical protein
MKRLLILTAFTLAVSAVIPAMALPRAPRPVNVTTCLPSRNVVTTGGWVPGYYPRGPYYYPSVYGYRYYQPRMRTSNPTLSIDYTNATANPMKEIEFGLVANGNLVAEVKDVGTFSPGVEIKHQFGLSPNVFPLQTGLARCVPLKIVYEDGTTWKNPHLPALKRKLGL